MRRWKVVPSVAFHSIRREILSAYRWSRSIAREDISRHFRCGVKLLRDTLERGARIGAFSKILPYTPPEYPQNNPMNKPVYQVGNFMLALAHSYAVVKEEYPEDTVLLAIH